MNKNWYRLDTAALLFPAVMNKNWSNAFRLEATINHEVDPFVLQKAVDDLKVRFPSFYVGLRTGFFWSYLQQMEGTPQVMTDFAYPLTFMSYRELKNCCIRILYYKNRVAVELFHAVTDGTGGNIYLCSLLARYLEIKFEIDIGKSPFVVNHDEPVTAEELEDSFHRYTNNYPASRKESKSYQIKGTKNRSDYYTLITGVIETERLKEVSKNYGCTITAFLTAVMIESLIEMQQQKRFPHLQKHVKVTIPINLRRLYGSKTVRNFVLPLNVGVDPKKGDYSLKDLCNSIASQLNYEITPQNMASKIASNVTPQKNFLLQITPLIFKRLVLGAIYHQSGVLTSCLNISNLGVITLPEEMNPFVERIEFIISPQKNSINNCSVSSYKKHTFININRNIVESELERRFFSKLVELNIPVTIECNRG
ncbi:MAG TPA: hypothetical protein PLI19_00935 [Erysipelotrichaceae bacterium]|nr:hypothetical protein [Erysipelotrichaceae bacterium]HQB31870.1 hypothetical protein [Erysipelotrichaceae bacterium]